MNADKSYALTDKGRDLVERMLAAERALALVWREPYETYAFRRRCAWLDRMHAARRACDAILAELS